MSIIGDGVESFGFAARKPFGLSTYIREAKSGTNFYRKPQQRTDKGNILLCCLMIRNAARIRGLKELEKTMDKLIGSYIFGRSLKLSKGTPFNFLETFEK